MNRVVLSIAAAFALTGATAAQATETITYNGAPAAGFTYGTGNGYSPANATVLTSDDGTELALRFHVTGQPAAASDANGLYHFALGTSPVSVDFGIAGSLLGFGDSLTLTNLGTGATSGPLPVAFLSDPLFSMQGSEQLGFAFLGLGFDPNVNDTYSATLTSGGHSLTSYAVFGSGAVPEPATWAMMLVGFGAIGFSMRRRRAAARLRTA